MNSIWGAFVLDWLRRGLEWSGLNGIELDWIGLEWAGSGLDWSGSDLEWNGLGFALVRIGLNRIGLALDWFGLHWLRIRMDLDWPRIG